MASPAVRRGKAPNQKMQGLATRLQRTWGRYIKQECYAVEGGQHECRICFKGIHSSIYGVSKKTSSAVNSIAEAYSCLMQQQYGIIFDPVLAKLKKNATNVRMLLEEAKPIIAFIDNLLKGDRYVSLVVEGNEYGDLNVDSQLLANEVRAIVESFATDHWTRKQSPQTTVAAIRASMKKNEVGNSPIATKRKANEPSTSNGSPAKKLARNEMIPEPDEGEDEYMDPDLVELSSDEEDCVVVNELAAPEKKPPACVPAPGLSHSAFSKPAVEIPSLISLPVPDPIALPPPPVVVPKTPTALPKPGISKSAFAKDTPEPTSSSKSLPIPRAVAKPNAVVAPPRILPANPLIVNGINMSSYNSFAGRADPPPPPPLPLDFEAGLLGVSVVDGVPQAMRRLRDYRNLHQEAFDILDAQIMTHYENNVQNDKVYSWKMTVRGHLLDQAKRVYGPGVEIYAVGSTINGCGSYNSDMDLCMVVHEQGYMHEERGYAMRTLNKIFKQLKKLERRREFVRKCELIRAVVPIIKMETREPYELEVDMNCNNLESVYNSHLLHYYSRVDGRFPAISLLVKHWAIKSEMNDAMHGTFNSYSLILMVLHYLQCGVEPAVLPNLQYLYPQKFADRPPLNELNLFQELDPPLPVRPMNDVTVGDLLTGFFEYYDNFDFKTNAISIRRGKQFPRVGLPSDTTRYEIFIEEPFDGKNTARCIRGEKIGHIRAKFTEAHRLFSGRSPPDLRGIRVKV